MNPADFAAYHRAALEADEVKHNVLLAILERAAKDQPAGFVGWTLGGPGVCAVKTAGRSIVLGNLSEAQCRNFADDTAKLDYPGVMGSDLTAKWFVARARKIDLDFYPPVEQRIYILNEPPQYPKASGHARAVTSGDAGLFADWLTAFFREATPQDPIPPREQLERTAAEGGYSFWIDGGRPVSTAGIVRRLKRCAAIAGVYTPPALRGHGYAGSVTAAVVERIYAEGRATACLYADVSNPFSNRCYANIGFRPVYESCHFYRRPKGQD